MIRNYLKIAIRNIQRHTSYTLINVLGLALGLTCVIVIFTLVKFHLSFDDFHADTDRIYRMVTEQHRDQISYRYNVPNPLGKVFREDYTFTEKVARICTFDDQLITLEENGVVKKFKESEVAFAETEFFDIFNYPLTEGNKKSALSEPHTAIITERMAHKYFGDKNPINQLFRLDNRIDFKVTGVLKDLPANTDRKTEMYLSYASLKEFNEWYASEDSWGGITSSMQCFIRLKPGVSAAEVESVLPAYVKKYRPTSKNVHHYKLQPLNDVHFSAQYGGAMEKNNLWILSLIGGFLLFTACVNFVNLATAQAVNRSKEVGVRKVLGGVRSQLFWQFITETGLITLLATVIAFTLSNLVLPYVNEWFDAHLSLQSFTEISFIAFVIALLVSVTFFAGAYPGLILSGFKPVLALKGKRTQQRIGGFNVRRSLIVTQFAISQVLIIGLIVIIYQMNYAKQSDMGFNKETVVMIPMASKDEKSITLNNQLAQISGVEKISLCYDAPASRANWLTSFYLEGQAEEQAFPISFKGGDHQFLSTFEIELVAGRNLLPADSVREFVVNETFVKKLNLTSPEEVIGKTISVNGGDWVAPIVGVVKDFHDRSFHEDIQAVFISTSREEYNYYAVKINSANVKNTLAELDKTWSAMYPDQIYEYTFLDEDIAAFYKTEERMMVLIQVFSFIAIFIGCMGLYGLVSFMALQKNKEIGIRKVLGSSVAQILWIFGKEFSGLLLIAFLIAAPAGGWVMSKWLQNFQYKIELNVWIFIAAITATSLIALITVGYQSLRAALTNPVKSLRSE